MAQTQEYIATDNEGNAWAQDLTISPEARIQILAIRAHAEVETAQRLIASYRRKSKSLTTETYRPMLAALADALEALTKAADKWNTIDELIQENPSMHKEA